MSLGKRMIHRPASTEHNRPEFPPMAKLRSHLRPEAGKEMAEGESAGSQAKVPEPANKEGLPSDLQAGVEQLSGENLSNVRVHRNSSEPDKINAHAYAQGEDIHLAPGQEKHLPHEAWHVVQQKQGRVQPTLQQKSAKINDNAGLEQEADVMGAKALQMKANEGPKKTSTSRFAARNSVIQRAMKFEFQIFNNNLFLDDGEKVKPLPRKYGPRDYLVRNDSGLRLESETSGQIEFETSWEKKWSKLYKQVSEMQFMAEKMNDAKDAKGIEDKSYKKFPFPSAIKHLEPNRGFELSGGAWTKSQKDGETEVDIPKGEKEHLRSTASETGKVLDTIKNGKEVFVRYYSGDRHWARINYKGTWGWIKASSLKPMKSKTYERKEDAAGNTLDKPLQGDDKLLVRIGDDKWLAKLQISESFKLEQFESYLKQHDKQLGPTLIPEAKEFIREQSPPKGAKREFDYLKTYPKLYNFLLMVMYYIERGRNYSTRQLVNGKRTGPRGASKDALALMSRTNFASMYQTLSKKEQALFKDLVHNTKKGILPHMGLTKRDNFYIDGAGSKTYFNVTVFAWLEGITKGEDLLSVQSSNLLSAAQGRHNIESEKGKEKDISMHEGLIRFENREFSGSNVPKSKWLEHTEKHFKAAAELRKRATGKNETGLEYKD